MHIYIRLDTVGLLSHARELELELRGQGVDAAGDQHACYVERGEP